MPPPPSAPLTLGIHHLGLTVQDVTQARDFFLQALGYAEVGGRPDYPAIFVSDGTTMITLWQAQEPKRARAFDRKHALGLHHVALKVADGAALRRLQLELQERPDVEFEFVPEALGDAGAEHMMVRAVGLRFEFIAVPS